MSQIVNYFVIAMLVGGILPSCGEKSSADNGTETTELAADITQLTDEQYPDNNDI